MPNFEKYSPPERPAPRRWDPEVAITGDGEIVLNSEAYGLLRTTYVGVESVELLCDPNERIIGVRVARRDSPDGVRVFGLPPKFDARRQWEKRRKLGRNFHPFKYIGGKAFLEHYGIPLREVSGKVYAADKTDGVLQADLKHPKG